MDDKVIVTNESALRAKYGSSGLRQVKAAVRELTAADKARGLGTRYVALDDARTMRGFRGTPVTSVMNCRQNKDAVDAVWNALQPAYLMILGSYDVVPHQDLRNPAHAAGDDPDPTAEGDLPYACAGPYSRDAAQFVGPTRVVSRLPDETGASDPDLLVRLLDTATRWVPRPDADDRAYFGLSAAVWRQSTELSLSNVFGGAVQVNLAPPRGPRYPAATLAPRMHFINCHGAESDPHFYGEPGDFPVSLSTPEIQQKIVEGTVAAVECCYGGQLYPAVKLGLDPPICQSYLAQGAYAYFGSTTIAYGPAEGNGAADLITQYFLMNILDGASVGYAALVARQQYVAQTGQMDPIDLKTLGQFCVYGDPSVHPVTVASATSLPANMDTVAAGRLARGERRLKLAATGRFLQDVKPTAGKPARPARPHGVVLQVLTRIAAEIGIAAGGFRSYAVRQKGGARTGKTLSPANRYHVLVSVPATARDDRFVRRVAIVAKEAGHRIVGYRVYYAR